MFNGMNTVSSIIIIIFSITIIIISNSITIIIIIIIQEPRDVLPQLAGRDRFLLKSYKIIIIV